MGCSFAKAKDIVELAHHDSETKDLLNDSVITSTNEDNHVKDNADDRKEEITIDFHDDEILALEDECYTGPSPEYLEKLVLEKAERERLAEFERNQDTPERVSLRYRYENARLMQQKAEEERLASIKRRKSTIKPARVDWNNSLNDLVQKQENRYQETKSSTISQFRVTDGSGLVKKIVGKWDELFMQSSPTIESAEESYKAAVEIAGAINKYKLETTNHNANSEMIENFGIGTTHIYDTSLFESHITSYLRRSLKESKSNYAVFPCGVYGEEAAKPPIEVSAIVMKASNKSIYIALTIVASVGKEKDSAIQGQKKIVVFDQDSNQKIFERVFDVTLYEENGNENNSNTVRNSVNALKKSLKQQTNTKLEFGNERNTIFI
eukprot:gene5935-8183_t